MSETATPEEPDEGSEEEAETNDDQGEEESEAGSEGSSPKPAEISDPQTPLSFSELMNEADEGNLTQQSLQDELNKYASAIRAEFEQASQEAEDLTRVEEYTRDFFKKNIHSAAAQVVWLANNAESESVRLKAATTVIHEALADARADGDPIKNLLNELTQQK